MPIVDAHIHLWSHDMDRYPDIAWREDGESRLPKVYGEADRIVEHMDAHGVAFALNVQVPWYREDNRYHLDAVQRYPGRFAFLAVMNLDPEGIGDRYRKLAEELSATGFRIHHNEIDRVVAGEFDALLEAGRELGHPLQFLGRAEHMGKLRQVIARFDGLKVVIDHLAHPNPAMAPEYADWADFFKLAEYPLSYVKVSLQVNCSKAPWPHRDLHGFTQRVLDAWGARRCMWGSNYPLIPETVSYDQVLAIVRDELPFLTGEDKDWVLGGTAASLWQPIG